MDPRTLRAAAMAAAIGLVAFGGLGAVMGFPVVPSLITGLVMGLLFAGLILWASKRADSLDPNDGPLARSPHGRGAAAPVSDPNVDTASTSQEDRS